MNRLPRCFSLCFTRVSFSLLWTNKSCRFLCLVDATNILHCIADVLYSWKFLHIGLANLILFLEYLRIKGKILSFFGILSLFSVLSMVFWMDRRKDLE